MSITLYHVPGTRSCRIIWLCEELGLNYELERISFAPEFRMSSEWLALNPVGKVPVLRDGDLTMFESGAMAQYLLQRYGDGRLERRPGSDAYAHYLQWCWFAEATFARPLGEIVNHRRNFDPPLPDVMAEMQVRSRLCAAAIDDAIRDRNYIVGDAFSAADIMLGYSLKLCEMLAPFDDYEQAMRYWRALSARPAAQVAFGDMQ